MATTVIKGAPTSSLADLEELADQQEEILGPLVGIGVDGPNTMLIFDMDQEPPPQFVILRETAGGQRLSIPGFALMFQSHAFVSGARADIAAFRASQTRTTAPTVHVESALERELRTEQPTAMTYARLITAAAAEHNLPAWVIAGIGSVETGWGLSRLMNPKGPTGTGDLTPRSPRPPLRSGSMPSDGLGFGRGLMQIDWDSHQFARSGDWRDPQANIRYACSVLAQVRDQCAQQAQQLRLSPADVLPVAVAAYNAGFGGVSQTIRQTGSADAVLGRGSYASKVLARASWYRANGFP